MRATRRSRRSGTGWRQGGGARRGHRYAARDVIERAGYGQYFTHRTGHSIDPREIHGSGPHIDNLETREERALIPGVGVLDRARHVHPEHPRCAERGQCVHRGGRARRDAHRVSAGLDRGVTTRSPGPTPSDPPSPTARARSDSRPRAGHRRRGSGAAARRSPRLPPSQGGRHRASTRRNRVPA